MVPSTTMVSTQACGFSTLTVRPVPTTAPTVLSGRARRRVRPFCAFRSTRGNVAVVVAGSERWPPCSPCRA
ncbi:hypothetical protein, partial [Nesterenkonia sp. PF2B19]|uniref:hypothetical protein n=1 Tax=Nesterenkonia sp. PF2B19 TaxID=1881858 RepID=UPI001F323D1C